MIDSWTNANYTTRVIANKVNIAADAHGKKRIFIKKFC